MIHGKRHAPVYGLICLIIFFEGVFSAGTCPAASFSRIVSLAPNLTEILYELELEKNIAAVTTYCNYPAGAKGKPKIGGMSNPSLEAVVAMKPDLVLLTIDGNPPQFERKLKQLGIRTYVFRAVRISELPDALRDLGRALGEKKRAEKLAAGLEKALREFQQAGQKEQQRGTVGRVLFIVQPEPMMAAGKGTAIDEAIGMLGWNNIASRAEGPYPKISIEEVITRSPDIVFVSQDMGGAASGILKKMSSVAAVRKGRVYYMSDALFRMSPRVVNGIAEMDARFRGREP